MRQALVDPLFRSAGDERRQLIVVLGRLGRRRRRALDLDVRLLLVVALLVVMALAIVALVDLVIPTLVDRPWVSTLG